MYVIVSLKPKVFNFTYEKSHSRSQTYPSPKGKKGANGVGWVMMYSFNPTSITEITKLACQSVTKRTSYGANGHL